MAYFDSEKNVDGYLKMIEGYDGAALIGELKRLVPAGARLLELGMGGGGDLDLLAEAGFEVTGSDASSVFLKRYAERGGNHRTLVLDAETIETTESFDVVFSNKVLHHLTRDQMRASLRRQAKILNEGGTLFHSLWAGTEDEEHHGMLFTKYTEANLEDVLPETLECVASARYEEMGPDDSLWVALRRSRGR